MVLKAGARGLEERPPGLVRGERRLPPPPIGAARRPRARTRARSRTGNGNGTRRRAQVQQAAFRPPAFVYGNDDEDNEDQDDDENWGWFETAEPELGQAYMPPIHQPPSVQASASWDSTHSDDFLYE